MMMYSALLLIESTIFAPEFFMIQGLFLFYALKKFLIID